MQSLRNTKQREQSDSDHESVADSNGGQSINRFSRFGFNKKNDNNTRKSSNKGGRFTDKYTIAIVTHSMQQAARVSQRTAYFHLGRLIEVGDTNVIFTMPSHQLTENYITGRFG